MFAGFNAHARAEASLVLASVAGLRLPEYFGNGSHLTYPPPPQFTRHLTAPTRCQKLATELSLTHTSPIQISHHPPHRKHDRYRLEAL
jgi:hypothetical protein